MSEPSIVSWASDGGILTKNAPLTLQPGSQLRVDNARQERKNEWRTRPGTDHNAADDLPGGVVPVMCTGAPWSGFVGLVRATTYDAGGSARIYSPTAGTRWITPNVNGYPGCSQLTPASWSRSPVAPMTTGNIGVSQASAAQGGNYRLTAWWARSGAANTSIQVSLQSIDGATIKYWANFAAPAACRPRCVYSSAAQQLCLFYIDDANHVITYTWNATTGALVNAAVTLATDGAAAQAAYLDAIYYGGNTISIAYRNNVGPGNVGIVEYDAAANTSTLYTQLINCANGLAWFPDPDVSGIRMLGVASGVPSLRVFRFNAVGAVQTNDLVAVVDPGLFTGCAYNGGLDWMVVYGASVSGTNLTAYKRRAGVTSAAKLLCPAGVFTGGLFFSLVSGAWREPGTDAMRYLLGVSGNASDDAQPTYLEMALEFENASAQIDNNWAEPQSRILPLNAAVAAVERGALGQVFRLGPDRFFTALGRIVLLTDPSDNLGGPQFAIDAWTVQYLNAATYTTQNVGEGTQTPQDAFLPAGSLLQTATGQIVCGHGASAIPFEPASLTPSVGAGNLDPTKTYIYGVTVSMPDELGNEWRSPMSVTKTIAPGGAWVGPNNTITISGALTPFENQLRRRIVMLWRNDGDGATLKLLHVIDSTVANTMTYSYVDATSDVDTGQEYQFQLPGTTGGELEATLTPALLHPTLWGGRLWGIDRDFPTRVRYSKPLSAGLLPEFPDEFVNEIEDAEGGLTGLAAMDDKIVAFKQSATYVAGGDGPGNDGGGTPFSFQIISSEAGAIVGAPLLATGAEVYMVTLGGVFRVKRSQEIDFVGAAIDLYLSMPLLASPETVTGMVLSSSKNEVRVQTTNYRFVHDRIFDVWERDTGGMTGNSILFTRMLGTRQALFLANGQMWIEAADSTTPTDAGTPYSGIVRGPWMRPMNMEGRIRLSHLRAVGECTAPSGVVAQPAIAIFFDNDESLFEVFRPRAPVAAIAGPIRSDAKPRRQLCSAFSSQFTLPSGDATVRFDAWSALVSVEPGMQGLGASNNWAPSP